MAADFVAKICKTVPNSILDKRVQISFLDEIARDLDEWEVLAPEISLTRSEQMEIEKKNCGQYRFQT
jgi:hypothetical protein